MPQGTRCKRLAEHGWERGRKNAKVKLQETAKLRAHRAEYLAAINANRTGAKLREVFTDESYIHQHYHHDDRSLYDPQDKDGVTKQKHHFKGDRYNIIGCILGPDLAKPENERADTLEDKGGWYAPAYDKFHAPIRTKKDYHACFDAKWYEAWFKRVCQQLAEDGYKCLIILDNVSYHKATHLNKLKKLSKAQLFATLRRGSEDAGEDPAFWNACRFPTKVSVLAYLSTLETLVAPTVETIAAEYGHKVLYTPPYHSDLQPIEIVWAVVKQKVAAGYHINRTMEEVLAALDAAFATLKPTTVYGCYKRAVRHEALAQQLVDADEARVAAEDNAPAAAAAAADNDRNDGAANAAVVAVAPAAGGEQP